MDKPCIACGKPIRFVVSGKSGKKIPLSLETEERRLVENELGAYVVRKTYLSHFADCPEADRFRKGGS